MLHGLRYARYLKGTLAQCFELLYALVDLDRARDAGGRKSDSWFCFSLGSNIISLLGWDTHVCKLKKSLFGLK